MSSKRGHSKSPLRDKNLRLPKAPQTKAIRDSNSSRRADRKVLKADRRVLNPDIRANRVVTSARDKLAQPTSWLNISLPIFTHVTFE